MKLSIGSIGCLLLSILLTSCNSRGTADDTANSIYYWRTTFSLSDKEKEFIKDHDVKKIYMRFFDVGVDYGGVDGESVIPEATIEFIDSVPAGIEVVPTVYITTAAIQEMQLNQEQYAEKIVKRVTAMCRGNHLDFKELQLDCDWTKRSRSNFFKLCEAVKQRLDSTQTLSSTIRLHQLTQTPPPVDKGVLMVYNTGNLTEISTDNSIFSQKDIEPYLRDNRLADYRLPLDVAYPIYGWSLAYDRGADGNYRFNKIIRQTDWSACPELEKIGDNLYEAKSRIDLSGDSNRFDMLFGGSRIRVERPAAKEILKVKSLIDKQLSGKTHNNILYHLDESQFSHYTDNEISDIYSRN